MWWTSGENCFRKGYPGESAWMFCPVVRKASCIAVDEITAREDAEILLQAANCGVRLLATAHARSLSDFRQRNVYQPLVTNRIFETFLVLKEDKTFTMERMTEWVTSGLVQY